MKLVSLSDAFHMIDNIAGEFRIDVEKVELRDAVWRILAENITVDHDIPRYDRAAVDGVATKWKLISEASQGKPVILNLGSDESVKSVHMGEPLPEGFDVVLRWEHVRSQGEEIAVSKQFERWMNVDRRGSFFREGDFAMRRGRIIGPQDVALLSELGYSQVPVYRRVKASIISIGRELIHEKTRALGNDYAYVVASLLKSYGVEVNRINAIPDDVNEVENAVRNSLRDSDLILTLGRASMGVNDVIPRMIEDMKDVVKIFHGVAMYPGKPTGLVKTGEGKAWIILPGSILAALSATAILVRRLLRKMLDVCGPEPMVSVLLDEEILPKPGISRVVFLRLILEDESLVGEPLPKGVDNLFTLTYAQAYLVVEPGKYLRKGDRVLARLITGLAWPPHSWSSQYF